MEREDAIAVNPELSVPRKELRYTTSRSSGPGGQNVNKVESKVTLWFDLETSTCLDPSQKDLVRQRLATRVTRAGLLRVVSQKHRTQAANRKAAEERFAQLLRDALTTDAPRRPTRKPRTADRRRLESKGRLSRLKETRRKPTLD